MLSYLLKDKFGLIVLKDNLGEERVYDGFFRKLLFEKNASEEINVKSYNRYDNLDSMQAWLQDECDKSKKWNIILPPFSDLLAHTESVPLLKFLTKLIKYTYVQRIMLWITPQNCSHDHIGYLIGSMEYLAKMIIHIRTSKELTITIRKARLDGNRAATNGISIKNYLYKKTKDGFSLELYHKPKNEIDEEEAVKEKANIVTTTFKIELDEDELIARNSIKMPYERTADNIQSNITYIPDANDDFDDEDPDDDLSI